MDKELFDDLEEAVAITVPITSGSGRQMTLKDKAHVAMDKWAREAPIDLKEVDVLAMYDYILYLEAGGDDGQANLQTV